MCSILEASDPDEPCISMVNSVDATSRFYYDLRDPITKHKHPYGLQLSSDNIGLIGRQRFDFSE